MAAFVIPEYRNYKCRHGSLEQYREPFGGFGKLTAGKLTAGKLRASKSRGNG